MFPAKAVSTLGKRVHCAHPRDSNHGWGTRWPFAGGRGVASIRMVCLGRKGYLSPFSGLSHLHSVHVGLHLSHERCFGKLTVLPWQKQHQHLLMEQPLPRMESDSGQNQHKCVTSRVRLMCNVSYELPLDVSRGQGSPMAFSIPHFPTLPCKTSLSLTFFICTMGRLRSSHREVVQVQGSGECPGLARSLEYLFIHARIHSFI